MPTFKPVEITLKRPAVPMADISARLPKFVGLAVDAPAALSVLRVLVVGAGSVGLNVLLHLARLGVGVIHIVDHGRYKAESLLTQGWRSRHVLPDLLAVLEGRRRLRVADVAAEAPFAFDDPM